MESEEAKENQNLAAESKEGGEPKLQCVRTTNGLAIKSKLNPDAKEFYPSYMLQRASVPVLRREVDAMALEQMTLPPEHLTKDDIMKVDDEAVSEVAIACEKDMPKAEQAEHNDSNLEEGGTEEKLLNIAEGPKKAGSTHMDEHAQEEEKVERAVSAETIKARVLEKQVNKILMEGGEVKEHGTYTKAPNEEHLNKAEVIDDEMKTEVEIEEIPRGNLLLKEEEQSSLARSEMAEVASYIKLVEPPVLYEIIEEPKETSVCGDTTVVAERVGDNSQNNEEIGDCAEHSETVKVTLDPGFVMQINPCDSGTNIKPEECCVPTEESRVPPTTPNEDVHDSLTANSKKLKENLLAAKALEKKKTEKRSAVRKLSNIALGLTRKSATSTTVSSEKTTSSERAPTPNAIKPSSAAGISRTKRISESLHNLSTSLKSKSDTKKTDSNAKLLPRSTTSIPKPPVRSRTQLSKAPSDSSKSLKDAISLKSTSSAERSFSSRSTLSSSSKTVNSKSSGTNTKSSEKSAATASSKPKEGSAKLPRGTVASSLRQTEAQKVS